MSGTNGKTYLAAEYTAPPGSSVPARFDAGKIAFKFLPTTPVGFTGEDAVYAWLRLALYGSVAYLSWGKARSLSYIAMGAAGVSAAVSFSTK